MSQIHTNRPSGSPYIDRVWATTNVSDGTYLATPDGLWDLLFLTLEDGSRGAMLAGQATKPAYVPYTGGTSAVVISFAAGAYIPQISGKEMIDQAKMLPMIDATHFELAGHVFEIPDFDNAEHLVEDMAARGLLKIDEVVAAVLSGNPKAMSDRAMQRHFVAATGLTRKMLDQIQRAQAAVRLLQSGKRPVDAAAETGYTDQPHLAKSLKRIMDSAPSDVSDIHKL